MSTKIKTSEPNFKKSRIAINTCIKNNEIHFIIFVLNFVSKNKYVQNKNDFSAEYKVVLKKQNVFSKILNIFSKKRKYIRTDEVPNILLGFMYNYKADFNNPFIVNILVTDAINMFLRRCNYIHVQEINRKN